MGNKGIIGRYKFKRVAARLLGLVFPENLYCICCGNIIDDSMKYGLCGHCMEHIRWNNDAPKKKTGVFLIRCAEYGIYERSIIFSLKYNGKRFLARKIAEIMRDRLAASGLHADLLIPVPMYKEKERRRGFNHAELISKYLSELTGITHMPTAIKRVRNTVPMRSLGPAERARNIAGSIEMNAAYSGFAEGKTVLIVDDFYTTGSTAAECASALSAAGADKIFFIAFAAR